MADDNVKRINFGTAAPSGAVARGGDLPTLGAPAPRQQTVVVAAPPQPAPAAPPAKPATNTQLRRRVAKRRGSGLRTGDSSSVYVAAEVRRQLRLLHKRLADAGTPRTFSDIVLDALDATADELPELLKVAGSTRPEGSRFVGRQRKNAAPTGEDLVQIVVRWSTEDLATIDAMVDENHATNQAVNRSMLVAAALKRYLAQSLGKG